MLLLIVLLVKYLDFFGNPISSGSFIIPVTDLVIVTCIDHCSVYVSSRSQNDDVYFSHRQFILNHSVFCTPSRLSRSRGGDQFLLRPRVSNKVSDLLLDDFFHTKTMYSLSLRFYRHRHIVMSLPLTTPVLLDSKIKPGRRRIDRLEPVW